jgi:hypothetical protein
VRQVAILLHVLKHGLNPRLDHLLRDFDFLGRI